MRREPLAMHEVPRVVGQREDVHLVPRGDRAQLMKRTDLLPLVGRVRHPVAEEQDSHGCSSIKSTGSSG